MDAGHEDGRHKGVFFPALSSCLQTWFYILSSELFTTVTDIYVYFCTTRWAVICVLFLSVF